MSAPEILPCPFCGLDDFVTIHAVGSLTSSMPDRPYQVRCRNLSCEDVAGPVEYGKYQAISAWNRRNPEVQALIAKAATRGRNEAIEAAATLVETFDGPTYADAIRALKKEG